MGTIELFLAKFFASFKVKQPIWAAIILGLLAGFAVALEAYPFFGETTTVVLQWITFVLAALTGTHTTAIMKKAEAEEKKL